VAISLDFDFGSKSIKPVHLGFKKVPKSLRIVAVRYAN
jgi:hypothetical protein